MNRKVISILVSLVMIFSFSACAKSEDSKTNVDITTVSDTQPQENENFTPWQIQDCFEYRTLEDIKAMPLNEVETLVQDMVYMSQTANLSPDDMNDMGWMFQHIWYQCKEYDKSTLKSECCEVFENIYNRAIEIGLPLDFIVSWFDVPVTEIAIKYISSDNFQEPYNIWGRSVIKLSEEDLLQLVKAYVSNPLMETNATIARTIICVTDTAETSKIAWEHLIRLSNSKAIANLSTLDTFYICREIFDDYDLNYQTDIVLQKVYSSEYIIQIAENVLENPAFDFTEKYRFFCSDFLSNSDLDIAISQMAMDKLQLLLDESSHDECVIIAELLYNLYYDESGVELHNISKPLHEKYFNLLTYSFEKMSA